MKLIGSRIEQILIKSLKSNKEWLFYQDDGKQFLDILLQLRPTLKAAYVLQSSDLLCCDKDVYTFLTDKKEIFVIEINRVDSDKSVLIEQINFHDYKKSLRGKDANLKLIIALKLIEEDLKAMESESVS